jgi:hypothetical protein
VRLLAPFLATTVLLAPVSPAAASEPTHAAEWGQVCLAAKGDARLAARLALNAGWSERPGAGAAYVTAPGDFSRVYGKTAGGVAWTLRILREQNTRPRHRRPLMQCIVSAPGGENPAADVAALLGGPPVGVDHGASLWMLDGSGDVLTALRADEVDRARRLAAADQAVIVHAGRDGEAGTVCYEGPSR